MFDLNNSHFAWCKKTIFLYISAGIMKALGIIKLTIVENILPIRKYMLLGVKEN